VAKERPEAARNLARAITEASQAIAAGRRRAGFSLASPGIRKKESSFLKKRSKKLLCL
jgi:hypothetical protein